MSAYSAKWLSASLALKRSTVIRIYIWDHGFTPHSSTLLWSCFAAKPLFLFCLQKESREKQSTQGHRWSTAFKKKTLSVCIFVNISKRREKQRKEMSILHFTVNNCCANLRVSAPCYMEVDSYSTVKLHRSCSDFEIDKWWSAFKCIFSSGFRKTNHHYGKSL